MIKHKEQRVGVLVDVSNMYHSAKNLYNSRVDFSQVLKAAVSGRKLIRAIAYAIKTKTGEEELFFEALSKQGFEVKMKELQIFLSGVKKADWDVGIAVDAIKLSDKLDVIVLVTGDGDYIPLVEYLQNTKGCLVEILAFQKTCSSRLVEAADDFIDLGEYKKYLK
ncbi:hypothetical protein A2242_04185 [Candidatus Falkowbacteria bacterium RIFOXYA2_FULL_47_9]|uniref:NYN domain-containing protein n=1 Tax=Candidatus Falkowbacteria bacterium RIFOXYA2_FULL_47_9 TaxID=1797995 RepID=A0A1F5SP36_9BACT|nr:MAG: hypothetical protein A2242_04185 [Candidatus Falkowbacteria bacterium RIFOXYA2_FULL_47_9]